MKYPKPQNKKKKKLWNRAKVIKMFSDLGIKSCEVKLSGCENLGQTPAHRKKRRHYTDDSINSFNEIVIACPYCHDKMEKDPELTKKVFIRLRDTYQTHYEIDGDD